MTEIHDVHSKRTSPISRFSPPLHAVSESLDAGKYTRDTFLESTPKYGATKAMMFGKTYNPNHRIQCNVFDRMLFEVQIVIN